MPTYTILQRYLSRDNKTWYGRINDGGIIKYKSLKTMRKADAQAWLDSMNAARFFPDLVVKERSTPKMVTVFIDYLATKEKTLGSSISYTTYENIVKRIGEYCKEAGISNVMDWTPKKAQDFSTWLTKKYGASTNRQIVSKASQIFRWATRNYSLSCPNPFEGVEKPKIVKRVKEFWTPEEIDRILDNAQTPGLRLEWSFMAFAGLRRHEANKVKPEDVKGETLHVIGKGNKEAFLPISGRLLKEIRLAGGIVHDVRFDTNKLKDLKKAAKEAGASGKANPHKFRHSFASNLFRAGVGIKHVQELMRHENVEITLNTYGHLLPKDLEKAVEAIK